MGQSDTRQSSPASDLSGAHDADIADLYGSGVSTSEIAHRLGMRGVEVIGRIRALKLKPPNVVPPVSSAPVEATSSRARVEAASPRAQQDEDIDDDEEDGFNAALRRLPGRPRGWLITEQEFTEMSKRLGGRFEEARFRTSTKTS